MKGSDLLVTALEKLRWVHHQISDGRYWREAAVEVYVRICWLPLTVASPNFPSIEIRATHTSSAPLI